MLAGFFRLSFSFKTFLSILHRKVETFARHVQTEPDEVIRNCFLCVLYSKVSSDEIRHNSLPLIGCRSRLAHNGVWLKRCEQTNSDSTRHNRTPLIGCWPSWLSGWGEKITLIKMGLLLCSGAALSKCYGQRLHKMRRPDRFRHVQTGPDSPRRPQSYMLSLVFPSVISLVCSLTVVRAWL